MLANSGLFSTIPSHSIFALASPRFKSALAIIRITGDDCISRFKPLIIKSGAKTSIENWQSNLSTHCSLQDPNTGEKIDEALVIVYREPKTYTGQNLIEIIIHGGLIGINKLLNTLETQGFETARPGEFTLRAYLNGKLDLTQAEAIQSIIDATNNHAHSIAIEQLAGSVSKYINDLKNTLTGLAAICSVSLDYPDDEIQESTIIDLQLIQTLIQKLRIAIKNFDLSRIQREGARIIIAGRTNAGKSELFNALLKENRAIVSEQHGTTRDYLESQIILNSIPLRLFDTAGLRTSSDNVEIEGIKRTKNLILSADMILYVIDSTLGLQNEDQEQLSEILENQDPKTLLIVWNKIDAKNHLGPPKNLSEIFKAQIPIIELSAQNYIHIDTLQAHIYDSIHSSNSLLTEDLSVITNQRQRGHLEECLSALVHVEEGLQNQMPLDMISLDLGLALSALGAITGEVSNEEILDLMFSTFCVGK